MPFLCTGVPDIIHHVQCGETLPIEKGDTESQLLACSGPLINAAAIATLQDHSISRLESAVNDISHELLCGSDMGQEEQIWVLSYCIWYSIL